MPEASSPNIPRSEFPSPLTLLRKYGLRPRKSLGQNFLVNLSLAEKIVELSQVPRQATVVELGVGLGTLTYALAQRVRRVIGFELDEKLIKVLKAEGSLPENVELRAGDILKLDYRRLSAEIGHPLILFGNLPYYLSSRLTYKLLKEREALETAVFMFQKEVAERFVAKPGSKDYGQLSVLLGLMARVEWLLTLSPAHFYPRPEVSSAVLKLEFKPKRFAEEEQLFSLVKVAFAKRRKKLARNLTALGLSLTEAQDLLKEVGLSPDIRAEAVPPEGFLALAKALRAKALQRHQGA